MTLVYINKITRLHKIDGLWHIELLNNDGSVEATSSVGWETLAEAKDNA